MDTAAALDALARRAVSGDDQAFTALIVATQLEVRLFVSARVVSGELVEEVVQATFVTAFQRLATYTGPERLTSWLKGIAHNRLREELRHRRRQVDPGEEVLEDLLQRQRGDGGDEVGDGEHGARLLHCLGRLSPRARQVVERRYLEGHSLTVLAQQFKQSTGTLAVLLHRVRGELRRCLLSVGAES